LEFAQNERYNPKLYGNLKADFLSMIDNSLPANTQSDIDEVRRQELLKELKDGKLLNLGR
jgi:hypothetical protein